MRKLLIISLISLCLSSCDTRKKTDHGSIRYVEFTYKGHDMVEFDDVGDYGTTIIHSPECRKCFLRYD